MNSLRCKRMDSKELIKCTFDLTKTELRIFLFLLKLNASVPSIEISKKIGLDRTTIQKSLKKLLEKKIIDRRQNNLDNGGYVFLYSVKQKEPLKEQMKQIIDEWKTTAQNQLENLFDSEDL